MTKTAAARERKEREYAAAEARGRRERDAGLHAESAYYEISTGRVVLELRQGYLFGIPLTRLSEIAGADPEKLRQVEVQGAGTVLHWEDLDADYSIPALIAEAIGPATAARTLGRAGGSARSKLKSEAARRNGRKGGRPGKKKTAR
jgi:hypothetical protein